MSRLRGHIEHHLVERLGWLRAAVLGANDGLLSTASLIIGVAAAQGTPRDILIAGVSGLVAGAMSMAAGEYVSVSSQADSESADLSRERQELHDNPDGELRELANIYVKRGLNRGLATEVAEQLMAHDALGAHARDELGISDASRAQPVQAALASAAAFSMGAIAPLLVALAAPLAQFPVGVAVAGSSLLFLAVLGYAGAKTGGANVPRATVRVTFWGAMAMAVTAGIGYLFGVHVG
jgi:VIT1/CCC1 family predicted Fe2+/Mn2+ transporter